MENESSTKTNPTLKMQITIDASDLTTCYKAANYLKVHWTTIYRLIQRGELRAYPIGNQKYLSIKEVEQLKEKRDEEAKTKTAGAE